MDRKVTQIAIATSPHGVVELICLCDDGTMWRMQETGAWTQIRQPPQTEEDSLDPEPEYSEPADTTTHIEPMKSGTSRYGNFPAIPRVTGPERA